MSNDTLPVARSIPPPVVPVDPGALVSPDALAERWSCSRAFVYKCLNDGLPSLKLGRARRIRVGDADAWLDAQQAAS